MNDALFNKVQFFKFCMDHQHEDINIRVINEGHCLRFVGVYDILDLFEFTSVTLVTSNLLEKHARYKIELFSPYT